MCSILSLNIQNGQIWDGRPEDTIIDLDATIDFLRAQNADIFLLQELEFPEGGMPPKDWHPNFDRIAAAFPEHHGIFSYPCTQREYLPFGVGLAIFSRFPLLQHYHLVLPSDPVHFEFKGKTWLPADRSLLAAEVEIDGRRTWVLNTHLMAWFMVDTDSNAHPSQRELLRIVAAGRKGPMILGGDFNCTPHEHTIEIVESTGLRSAQKTETTWYRQPLVLDHVFYSEEFACTAHEVIRTKVSDHAAVRAELSFVGGPET